MAVAVGCTQTVAAPPPLGQVVLVVDTDAPVPYAAPQATDPMRPAPLFDRLRVDVLPPPGASCAPCTREFDVHVEDLQAQSVSVGILPAPGVAGYAARLRLYPARFALASAEPDPDTTIDVTVALPVVGAEGVVHASALLSVDDVAAPKGGDGAPVALALGDPPASSVGTWPGAQRVDCATTPPSGRVCVPGGAFWAGDPPTRVSPQGEPLRPRLVTLSPYVLDATEVTVAAYRAAGERAGQAWSGGTSGSSFGDFCTFTAAPGAFESYPVNCIFEAAARDYCRKHGGDLPTEMQLEYVDGALESSLFAWGNALPACGDAVYERGGWGILLGTNVDCQPQKAPGGPLPVGSARLDRLDLPTGTLVDLAGNVDELVRDTWNRPDEPCWLRPGIYTDPVCTAPSPADGAQLVARSGNWISEAAGLEAVTRTNVLSTSIGLDRGFRCAYAGGP